MRKLIAIGGGEENTPGAFPKSGIFSFDKEIITQLGKVRPKLLFIPTATKDWPGYIDAVQNYFGKRLGCEVDTLLTVKQKIRPKGLKSKILSADIVYVGGGNTLYMMRQWKRLGIDKLLLRAYNQGVVMAGLSAGAICWFQYGTSDSRMLTDPTFKDYIRVSGLGWYPLILSPHHLTEKKRKPSLIKQVKKYGGIGLALDDYAAIEIIGTQFRIITSKPIAKAYKVYKQQGVIHYDQLEPNVFFDLNLLLSA